MAQDLWRFGHTSTPKQAWAPSGIRPKAPGQVICESSSVYSAVAPEQGLMTCLILPSADTAMMNLFLVQVAQDFADSFIVMSVDQAGWHWTKGLYVPEAIRLIFQTEGKERLRSLMFFPHFRMGS